jgi:hypothetical protein
MMAGHRKDHGRRLRALPKAARRAIQIERLARKQKFLIAGNTAAELTNLSEGRMQLIANAGKRKNKLTPGQIDAITRSMTQSARRLKVGMATGNRGRMKYNPKALQLAPSTAARTIRGARVGGVARKGKAAPAKPTAKVDTKQAISRAKKPVIVTKIAGNNAARAAAGKPFKRTGKAQRLPGQTPAGTISKSQDSRNKANRMAAFKRRVNRASDSLRGAGETYLTYAKAHKFGNAPGQGAQIERSYEKALKRALIAKKALAIYQGTARPTVNDRMVWGRPYGKNRPGVSRASKGYRPAAERLPKPSKAAQRQGRALSRHAQAGAQKRHYKGPNLARTLATTARALKFYQNPAGYLNSAKNKQNRSIKEGAGFRLPRGMARKAGATAAKPPQPSRPDTAQANIPMRGARGRQLDASISRAVKEVQAAQRARLMKPKEQVRAETAARKAAKEAAAAAKPKRAPRSAKSLRLSRAKQIEKRRGMSLNPAGSWDRPASIDRMAANAARTQQRALAFYGGKAKKKAVASNATAAKSIKPEAGKAPKRISYLLAYHGTNKESAAAIRAGGYKGTRYGTYGDGVYATTSRKAAREYANWRAAGGKNKFGEAFPASALGPAVLTHRIPKGRINKGDLPGYMISDWVKSGKARRVSKQATGHSPYVVMNEQLANRTFVNRIGTIRRPRKPRRKP